MFKKKKLLTPTDLVKNMSLCSKIIAKYDTSVKGGTTNDLGW